MRRPASEWDEEYILSLPREDDTFERKASMSLNLTLKSKDEVCRDLAKQISAFANSGGGQIIYGISDQGEVDSGGVGLFVRGNQPTKEWLEDLIPMLTDFEVTGVNVYEIRAKNERSRLARDKALYIVDIPDSDRAPHQSKRDHRYYVRVGAKSRPAGHRLIEDIRNRQVYPKVNVADVDLTYAIAKRKSSANTECALRADLLLRIANQGRVKAVNVCMLTQIDRASLRVGNPEAVELRAGTRSGELLWELKHPVYPGSSVPLRMSFSANAEYRVVGGEVALVIALNGQDKNPDELQISWNIFADSAPPTAGAITMRELKFCERALENFPGT
jgi:hypothetical protein